MKYERIMWVIVIIVSLVLILLFKVIPEEKVKEIDVCENVTIATINANSDLCMFGCVQYKGEFVPYDTLKYLTEFCKNQSSYNGSRMK